MPIPITTSNGPVLSPLISSRIPPSLCPIVIISFGHFKPTSLIFKEFNERAIAMPIYKDTNPKDHGITSNRQPTEKHIPLPMGEIHFLFLRPLPPNWYSANTTEP